LTHKIICLKAGTAPNGAVSSIIVLNSGHFQSITGAELVSVQSTKSLSIILILSASGERFDWVNSYYYLLSAGNQLFL